MRGSSLVVLAACLLGSTPARAQSADLEARVARLEKEAAERRAAPLPVTVSGYVHMDWVVFRQSSQNELTQAGAPLNEDRFVLRRARLRAERDLGLFHGAFEIDGNTVNGLQVRPINAEASFKWPADRPYARTPWAYDPTGITRPLGGAPSSDVQAQPPPRTDEPWFMVTAGLVRTPFGFEVPESERERPWLERSTFSSALFPQSFDLGMRVVGGFRFVRYAFAVMNGDPIGERTFPGRDPDKSKDMVFRVGGATALTDAIHVEGGLSGLTGRGFHPGQPATKDLIQWQDSNADGIVDNTTELQVIPGSPATPSETFKRFAVGADLRATITLPTLGDLHLRAEVVRGTNLDRGLFVSDPVVSSRDLRQLGWYVGAAQEVTRWALVGVRYDRYDPDADAREQEPFAVVPRDLAMSTWSFSATGRTRIARLVAQYDHRTNALGRDASGRPTTLADDSFTLRAEVRF
ncbi:MAG: phosphate-selective porin [Labilithrix sp.]|nr:phosphate-selective porin [Labilithrix sp.]